MMVKNVFRSRPSTKLALCLALVLMVSLLAIPSRTNAQVTATATTSGFGAAFGYAQTIGGISYAQAGSIGNGTATATGVTPWSSAFAATFTSGPAAAMSMSIGSPFGSAVNVQAVSFWGGFATAIGAATP